METSSGLRGGIGDSKLDSVLEIVRRNERGRPELLTELKDLKERQNITDKKVQELDSSKM